MVYILFLTPPSLTVFTVIEKSHQQYTSLEIEEMKTQLQSKILATRTQPSANLEYSEYEETEEITPDTLQTMVIIDPEFQNLIPPLSSEEKSQLETNLKEFGCIDPLIVWSGKGILLDGHNRYLICTQLQIPYEIAEIEIADRQAAICWIVNYQLGRRNITPETASYLRGKRYLHLKSNREDNLKQNSPKGKSCLSVDMANNLAEQYKVSKRTIRNDACFTKALDTLADAFGDSLKHSILSRTTELTKKDVLSLAKVLRDEGKELAQKQLDNKINKCDIVQQIKDKQRVPNPRHIGEVCQIINKGDAELKTFSGCWCIIFQVNPHSCAVRTWKTDLETVKPENLEPTYTVCEATAEQNRVRLRQLADKVYSDYEVTHIAVLETLARIPDPSNLTPKQEKIIAYLEHEC